MNLLEDKENMIKSHMVAGGKCMTVFASPSPEFRKLLLNDYLDCILNETIFGKLLQENK